ncbi:hypothetical protein BGZ76_000971 [Entomortierella beljakovae]|nr:hypothetical protein BGZ76_000971 [Entomortierella beljakovae]
MSRSTSFPSHAQMLMIRHEASLRKQALSMFGPQGVLDLALLGAILGNNIREIGRFQVTCDGSLVQGRYTIYELVHFGALFVTGRRRERQPKSGSFGERRASISSNSTAMSVQSTSSSNSTKNTLSHIYPTTLANLFPALVFKELRKKSIRPPKFQHDDSVSSTPINSAFHFENPSSSTSTSERQGILESLVPSNKTISSADSTLITNEDVLLNLVQQKLHRVKDLPLPRELCFLGAVSLPLPPVLRAMHIAWTIDFLNVRATTARRQRNQQKFAMAAATASSMGEMPLPSGGLEFRPDIYAYKMRVARLARAQQQQGKNAMRRRPSSTSNPIMEENEDENENEKEKEEAPARLLPPSAAPAAPESLKSIRQDKRLMQQLLSLENKVPRIVRQWSSAARSCFAEELIQEDRLVQEWVDRQRIQVVLASGYRFGSSAISGSNSQRRPVLSPISTTMANSLSNSGYANSVQHRAPASPLATSSMLSPRVLMNPPLSASRACFPEGVRLGSSSGRVGAGVGTVGDDANVAPQNMASSRPTSVGLTDRMSASQQMLSMHLWLSLLVSPLSPEHMAQDQFSFMDV